MKELLSKIQELKQSDIREKVDERILEFEKVGEMGNLRWFSELSFCVLTANFTAEGGIMIQKELGEEGFVELSPSELEKKLKDLGHRFYCTRAEYIVENRKYSHDIKDIVRQFSDSRDAREWCVDNIMGIGYKEGSHFLRNVGYKNLMILDRHILRLFDRHDIIDKIPKTLTENRYLNIEKEAIELARGTDLCLAELDLYLWYIESGRILK